MPADQNHAFDDGNRANFDAKSSQAKATESLPDFDKLPHIEEQQNRSQNFGKATFRNGRWFLPPQ